MLQFGSNVIKISHLVARYEQFLNQQKSVVNEGILFMFSLYPKMNLNSFPLITSHYENADSVVLKRM